MAEGVEVRVLRDEGDARGHAWLVGDGVNFLAAVKDIHVMTLNVGGIRGNHFHRDKREILLVEHAGEWILYWDNGPDERREETTFTEGGAVMVLVPPGCAHAIENRQGGPMRVFALSDRPYDPEAPDAFPRTLTPGQV